MTIKEAPLIKAVSRSGAWPELFFTNPVFCGMMPILLCAMAGGLCVVFVAALAGADEPYILYSIVRISAGIGAAIGFAICLVLVLKSVVMQEDASYYAKFLAGNLIGLVLLFVADFLGHQPFGAWLQTLDYVQ